MIEMNMRIRLWILSVLLICGTGCSQESPEAQSGEQVAEAQNAAASASNKTVYLTFDDGPYPNTAELLDILKEYQVPAAFFVIANKADYAADLYRRIAEEGHVLANHTASHDYKSVYADTASLKREMESLESYVKDISGCTVEKIFRFPGGSPNAVRHFGESIEEEMGSWGYRVLDWNCSGEDAVGKNISADTIYHNTVESAQGKDTVIVLLHSASYAPGTVEAMPRIIEYFQENGYRFGSITEEDAPQNWWALSH